MADRVVTGETIDAALPAMHAVTSRLTPVVWQHPGQVSWSARYALPEDLQHGPVRVFTDAGGPVGWAWLESPTWMEWCVDPAYPDLAHEAVAWFLGSTTESTVRTSYLDTEPHLGTALEAAGFVEEPDVWFVQHTLDLADLRPVPDVPGYALRAVRQGEAEARAACHRGSWSATSKVTTGAYERLMATPPYRAGLDWVAVTAEGEMVASCCVWLDDVSGIALVEPVGCRPEHRRRGLASAVSLAALHAARDAGGRTGLVRPRGDDDYPEPGRVYRGIGFRPGPRTHDLVLHRA
ncbi:GNAT family N-acetyltransferase [Nocardioides cynanchi]|uniref:GNAT family N-acetyltransferase n=1 Tax=Nocardioides cynanchi TaxID=2558918 RepID=UPI00192D90FA|nr:GNAT family N-acetyltransferase [Nocardioides cynanchi]